VWYVRRTSGGWSAPLLLGNAATSELSVDASGAPHVVLGWGKVMHRWQDGGTWQEHLVASDVDPSDVAIRAFGNGATIAWAQDAKPRGVWVVRD
jgi:hypothetical protein